MKKRFIRNPCKNKLLCNAVTIVVAVEVKLNSGRVNDVAAADSFIPVNNTIIYSICYP